MTFLDPVSALSNPGSLLSHDEQIVASYDLEVTDAPVETYRALSTVAAIKNANITPFKMDYSGVTHVHVINGMGVALGDSIMGLTALAAIKKRHPGLSFTIYRPNQAPTYVKQLYELAVPVFGSVVDLPVPLASLPKDELQLDIGNHLFWANFASMPMIDFFLWALGIEPGNIAAQDKSNDWLKQAAVPALRGAWAPQEYVLLCPTASTPVRSIPDSFRVEAVDRLWEKFHLPVLGFGAIAHERYTDITSLSPDTAHFLVWVKNARFLLTSDTAAAHIAAGFDVPTAAFFTTIPADMRVRDYRHCTSVDLDLPELQGMHASGRAHDLETVDRAYARLKATKWAERMLVG